jgi:copper(I)-binding protein
MLRIVPLLFCVCIAACGREQPPVLAENVLLTRPIPGASTGAGYLTLRNTTGEPIRIDRVASPELAAVAMHESVLEDGTSRMHALPEIVVLPHSEVVFEAGGKHLMLTYSAATPETVTLQFFAGPAMLLSVQANTVE